MYKKKDMHIKSYEGQDAFYSGTDEEYEEFLKNSDVQIDYGDDAEPVENTQRINLAETINLQNVIDRFKKTAGGIGTSAKNLKDNVVNKMKSKHEEGNSTVVEKAEEAAENITGNIKSGVENAAQKVEEIKEEVNSFSRVPQEVGTANVKLEGISNAISAVERQLGEISLKMTELDRKIEADKKATEYSSDNTKEAVSDIDKKLDEIKLSVSGISKISDSVFDLKNTQMNTRNAVSNLETAYARLKKKCVLGVTVLSILSAIVIVLQIVLMLSK